MVLSKIKNRLFPKPKTVPIPYPIGIDRVLMGKVALVIGGSSGIGLSIAQTYERAGCKVVIAGSSEEKLKKACGLCGENVRYIVIDVTNVKSLAEKITVAAKMHEEKRIDILVNSFGVHHSSSFENITEEEYDKIMGINAKGLFFSCQAFCNYMIKNQIKGNILNISSSSALRPAWGPYQMSKWAVNGFTKGLAKKMIAHGIVVNAIAPGQTATPMLGKDDVDDIYCNSAISKRYLLPDEIATWATFLVSDLGKMIIGDTLYVTGGSGVITLDN